MTALKEKIHRHMTIKDIFSTFPHKAEKIGYTMTKAGLQCVGCRASTWETLEQGMSGHGFEEADIETMVQTLNAILEESVDLTAITLTEKAAKKYIDILESEDKQGWGLRFGEKKKGCSGFEYELDYAKQPQETDSTFTSHGIEIYVETALLSRLLGSTIDWIDGLTNSGFKVSNPNVDKSCGCGTSHGYKKGK